MRHLQGPANHTHRRTAPGTTALGLTFLVLLCAAHPLSAQTYSNPLSTPGFPPAGSWFTAGPADPVVVEFEGTYYVYPTGNGFTFKVMWSDDLVHWTGDAVAFHMPGNSPWKNWALWAPEIERIDGRFYLYYTAGKGDLQDQRIGVADADTPIGPFVDRSLAAPLIAEAAIDAECFQDEGNLYLYYVRHQSSPFKLSIWVRELLDPLTLDPQSTPVLCIEPTLSWEAAVTEGPTIVKRDGRYYMFYSAWGANSPDYSVAVAVADHPLGPWVRQHEAYNPVLKRNDAIGLWGPGHGHNVIGPDGISDWYVYHHKINAGENFDRHLTLDRIVPVARHGSPGLHFTSSGGTTAPTPAPRMPFERSNFDDNALPESFAPESGVWTAGEGKLIAPADGTLRIARVLAPDSLQDFQWQWWLRAADGFVPATGSTIEFSFPATRGAGTFRAGWQIRPASGTIRFVETSTATGATVVHTNVVLSPAVDWSHHLRPIVLSKAGNRWQFLLDGSVVASVQYSATLGPAAYLRTTAAPCRLDGYRQTVAFIDEFECFSCTSDRWEVLGGAWTYVAPDSADDGHLRLSAHPEALKTDRLEAGPTQVSGSIPGADGDAAAITLCRSLAPGEFDLSADFMPVSQGAQAGYGLVHNYAGPDNYAVAIIDDARGVVTTHAVIAGEAQSWVDASVPMPPTFAVADYRNLAVTTDADVGEFIYSLNGLEVLRRAYPGLPVRGRAGLIARSADVRIDNFRFSDSTARPRIVVHPRAIEHAIHVGDVLPTDAVTVLNGGADSLEYQLSSDANWLTVSPQGGESSGAANEILLTYDLSGLRAGTYTGQVLITSLQAFNSPQVLTVKLVIRTVAPDFDGDGDVDMEDFAHLQTCLTTLLVPPEIPPGCHDADLTGDGHINFWDIAVLQACLSGSALPADRTCANP